MDQNSEKIGRRKFLTSLMGAVIAVAGGMGIFMAGGFLYPVARKKPEPRFICFSGDVPHDKPLEISDPAGRKVLLMRKQDGSLMAISTTCTHLGCTVYYREAKKIFECPCHQGVFDYEGNPVSGPPQTPLERYPVDIRDEMVFIQFS
jgi:cytochrome b6-f complex iron-sulfur subunit